MSRSSADRDLLVGALALQLEFVTREQLIDAALDAEAAGRAALIDRLQARGMLSADEAELLDALADRRLARHGRDLGASLAHCAEVQQAREILTRIENRAAADRAATTGLPAARAVDPHATHTPAPLALASTATAGGVSPFAPTIAAEAAPGAPTPPAWSEPVDAPRSIGAAQRFRIIRAFSRGGLGQVSLARDVELNRDVALKEILPKHADSDEARRRFLVEAEITGALEHPGVVPVYGLGQYADGRPFYAMRFIRGDDLHHAIDQFHRSPDAPDRELRFLQLLGRFVDVCNAIEYAHNRCVLHRDLKPGNIMLGKYGETLVVDWGLAKVVGSSQGQPNPAELPVRPEGVDDSTATQLGRIVGTPAYMSPEQALGRVDILGPATDIYSLGATLYHLLTGEAPFARCAPDSLLTDVRMGEFPPPRAVRGDVPRALQAICLKAMARQPKDRYASARGLADDVERYLADEPVLAYREPFMARLWRWMKRHRAAVLGAAAVLAVTAAALAVGVVLLDAANRREQRLREVADAQRARAESHFALARNAVREYYIAVSEDTLLDQPGMQPLRDQLLRQALEYYQKFLESGEQVDALRDEMQQANYFVGRITETLDTPAKALPFYEQAERLSAAAVAAAPDDLAALAEQGRTLNALGGALQKLQRWDESRRRLSAAETVRQRLVDAQPRDHEHARLLANTIMNLGTVDALQGDDQAAVARWKRAQDVREERIRADATNAALLADAGMGNFNLGNYYLNRADHARAEQYLKNAVAALERVGQLAPDDLKSQFRLATCYRTLAELPGSDGATDESRRRLGKAVELLSTLSLRNPQVPDYRSALAGVEIALAESWQRDDRHAEALAAIEQGVSVNRELVEQYPGELLYRRDYAVALRLRGEIHAAHANDAAARRDLQAAVTALEALAAEHADDADLADQLEAARAARAKLPQSP